MKAKRKRKAASDGTWLDLVVDAPPCAPDEERALETEPLSPSALALRQAMAHIDGELRIDFTERNLGAILELGGTVAIEPFDSGRATLTGRIRANDWTTLVSTDSFELQYVESREAAEIQSKMYPAKYEGWNEPPPPAKSAAQLAADAAQAKLEAIERAAVLAAELELAAEDAATRAAWLAVADGIERAASDELETARHGS